MTFHTHLADEPCHMHITTYTHLADKFVSDGFIAHLVSCQRSLQEEAQGHGRVFFSQGVDGLQAELEDTLTFLQPPLILGGRRGEERKGVEGEERQGVERGDGRIGGGGGERKRDEGGGWRKKKENG